jgi:hypothetical protein
MTTPIPPPVCSSFDEGFVRAVDAAVRAGWPDEEAFIAVVLMRAAGVAANEIVRLFDDCMRRVQ